MIKANETFALMGTTELHERLTFTKSAPEELIKNIQSYCNELVFRLNNQSDEEQIKVKAYFDINGIRSDINDADTFIETSKNLNNVDSFEFDVELYADYISAVCNANEKDDDENEIRTWLSTGLYPCINSLDNVTGFEYKRIEPCHNSGIMEFVKIVDGKNIDIDALANEKFPLTIKDTTLWNSVLLNMGYYRDDISDEQAEKIHNIVRKYIPEEEIKYCESDWEDCNDVILSGVQWIPENFKEISDFLNELNDVVVLPEEDRNKYKPEHEEANTWYDIKNFAIVFFAEVDGKFVLLGTDF